MKSVERFARAAVAAAAVAVAAPAFAAATVVIQNADSPGVGFNDPTPALPVGGNTGTTLGAQRLIAFQHAANIWGATLTSSVPIVVSARFQTLACSETAAVLGSAGPNSVFANFPGAPRRDTWYPAALADRLAGTGLDPFNPQIMARFNVNLGQPGCLTGSPFYLGLDGNEGSGVDLVATLLHELGHGLGFTTFTNGSSGAFLLGLPSIWDHYLLDTVTNQTWAESTATQRVASAISVDKLVWSGPNVTAAVPTVLRGGLPGVGISGSAAGPLAGTVLPAGEASFGPALTRAGVTGELMPVVGGSGLACDPLGPLDVLAVAGKVALVNRGTCTFPQKVKNVQNAGGIGVLIQDNVAGSPPPGMGGVDPTITIPAVRITQGDGNALRTQLATRSRTRSGVFARIGYFGTTGADAMGRVLMYAPATFFAGSSVSHDDTTATPNLLMEPTIRPEITQSLQPPQDLTFPLLRDIGW